MSLNLPSRGVGRRFYDADLSCVDPVVFADVIRYAEHAVEFQQEGRGLLLSGNPGIGKTWAMIALMRRLFVVHGESTRRWDFHVITAPQLFDLYVPDRTRGTEGDALRGQSWKQTFETVSALVINDLGKEDRSRDWLHEAVTYRLGRLLRARHERALPIFITTNLPLQAGEGVATVRTTYGESLWSLLYDMTAARVQTTAQDRRFEAGKCLDESTPFTL